MGKVMGGGLPAAAYGGPRELMELVAPAGDVYQAGTLSGNPLAVAAGLATLQLLDERRLRVPDGDDRDAGRGPARGRRRPARARRDRARPAHRLLLGRRPCTTTPTPRPATTRAFAAWCRGLLARGVYAPPSQYEAWFPSLAHDAEHVERTRRRRAPRPSGRRSEPWPLAAVHAALLRGGRPAGRRPGARADRGRRARAPPPRPGPRSRGREADVAFVIEAIREGELLHYGAPRLFGAIEPDLALLAGDRLYALGLARLAELGDVEAVCELADVIALCAQARAEDRPELADAVWQAGVAAVGWGSTDALRGRQGRRRRAGDPGAARRPPSGISRGRRSRRLIGR